MRYSSSFIGQKPSASNQHLWSTLQSRCRNWATWMLEALSAKPCPPPSCWIEAVLLVLLFFPFSTEWWLSFLCGVYTVHRINYSMFLSCPYLWRWDGSHWICGDLTTLLLFAGFPVNSQPEEDVKCFQLCTYYWNILHTLTVENLFLCIGRQV